MYDSQGLSPREMHPIIRRQYRCSVRTLQRDLETKDEWLPLITKVEGQATEALAKVLARLEIAQRRLLQLSYAAGSPNAMVGAAKGLVHAAMKEAELRIDSGQFRKAPEKLQVEVEGTVGRHEWGLAELLAEYGELIDEAVESATQAAIEDQDRQSVSEEDLGESLVS